jgi:acetylornithine deacetylase/succinyl-diaminopimelate desuccinylase-like protein
MLKADVILVSDTSMLGLDTPSITCGLRGLAGVEVSVANGAADLHSGIYGGAVYNPAMVLSKMLSQMIDENGHITIPGFYDDVRELSTAERKALNRVPFCTRRYKQAIGVGAVAGEEGYTTLERTGVRPTFEINGMWSGYTGEGSKTIIPAVASAKITMRLVPYQNNKKITSLFSSYFKSLAPKGVKVEVRPTHGGTPYVSPTDLPAYKAAAKAVKATFGKEPVPVYSGGSIGVISCFEQELGVKSILLGFGLSKDAIHSTDESYGVDQYARGIETIPYFYKYFAQE